MDPRLDDISKNYLVYQDYDEAIQDILKNAKDALLKALENRGYVILYTPRTPLTLKELLEKLWEMILHEKELQEKLKSLKNYTEFTIDLEKGADLSELENRYVARKKISTELEILHDQKEEILKKIYNQMAKYEIYELVAVKKDQKLVIRLGEKPELK